MSADTRGAEEGIAIGGDHMSKRTQIWLLALGFSLLASGFLAPGSWLLWENRGLETGTQQPAANGQQQSEEPAAISQKPAARQRMLPCLIPPLPASVSTPTASAPTTGTRFSSLITARRTA